MILATSTTSGSRSTDLEASVARYRRPLGVAPTHRERVEDQGVEEVLFAVGSSYIQLLGALGPDMPVGRSLAARGPGVHHWPTGSTTSWWRSPTCATEGRG